MALFKRKKPRGMLKKAKEGLWPSMGWRRTAHYYHHRLFRMGDSIHKIAGGLATGIAVSFTPFLGTHILQAFFFSSLMGASRIASLIGTLFGNPWTFPFIFILTYKTGIVVCTIFGLNGFVTLPEHMTADYVMDEPFEFLSYMFAHPQTLLLPLTVGGYLWGFLCWFIAYGVLYHPVRLARRAYRIQRIARYRKKKGHKKK